mgnify:FL=1
MRLPSDRVLKPLRFVLPLIMTAALSACGGGRGGDVSQAAPEVEGYGTILDAGYELPPISPEFLEVPNRRAEVTYAGGEAPGTIVIDPFAKFLYLVGEAGSAIRYPIAVGREGKGFSGSAVVGDMRFWPGWTPTANMVRREPEVYGPFAGGIPGGLASPLGARALYLHRGGRDTRYRIHGTNDVASIGNAGSAGCIRLFNHDVIDLFNRVSNGTRVSVRSLEESLLLEPEYSGRGVELPPVIVPPEAIYGNLGPAPDLNANAAGLEKDPDDVFSVIN